MLAKVQSYALCGLNGNPVEIEIDLRKGLPKCDVVGLADTAVKESRERVRSAIRNSGFNYPVASIVVNLAPADLKKEGSFYDLPIALGILSASEQLPPCDIKRMTILGELSLNGEVRALRGILPILISAKQNGVLQAIVPFENAEEASYVEGLDVYCVKTLREAFSFLKGDLQLEKVEQKTWSNRNTANSEFDFKYIMGQFAARRAVEIAVSGSHNVLLSGPPGAGKTMIAKAVPSIMPDLTFDEALEVAKIHSVAGALENGFVFSRPFRSPHHTTTAVSLAGGGAKAKPGEMSLAHCGVLFLDEIPEYGKHVLETLRQPLEDGVITVSRNAQTVTYPARFMLIGSMNPCPCGNYKSPTKQCVCTISEIKNYQSRISAALLDRIDINVEVDGVSYGDLSSKNEAESSAAIKQRVNAARDVQKKRFAASQTRFNSQMTSAEIKEFCVLDAQSATLLRSSFEKFSLSARAYNRILKVARTIADLDNSDAISAKHIAEALQYRCIESRFKL